MTSSFIPEDHDDNDYYEILGVNKDATIHEIRKAFLRRSLQVHPDKQANEEARRNANVAFVRLKHAYDVLYDPTLRKEYDHKKRRKQQKHKSNAHSTDFHSCQRESTPKNTYSNPSWEQNWQQQKDQWKQQWQQQQQRWKQEQQEQKRKQEQEQQQQKRWEQQQRQQQQQQQQRWEQSWQQQKEQWQQQQQQQHQKHHQQPKGGSSFYQQWNQNYQEQQQRQQQQQQQPNGGSSFYQQPGGGNFHQEQWQNHHQQGSSNTYHSSNTNKGTSFNFSSARQTPPSGFNSHNHNKNQHSQQSYSWKQSSDGCNGQGQSNGNGTSSSSTYSSAKRRASGQSQQEPERQSNNKEEPAKKRSSNAHDYHSNQSRKDSYPSRHHASHQHRSKQSRTKASEVHDQDSDQCQSDDNHQQSRIPTFGITATGEYCKRCMMQGRYCFQHKTQDPDYKQDNKEPSSPFSTRKPKQHEPKSSPCSSPGHGRSTVFGVNKTGEPCKRCQNQRGFCFQHKDQEEARPKRHRNTFNQNRHASSNTNGDPVFGLCKDGKPCKRCQKQGRFCFQHTDQE